MATERLTTTSALITATLAVVAYSLWVRRHTWRSRWEIGASCGILLEGCALVLMSPWASAVVGPPLHRITGLWNLQTMLGHLCLIAAIASVVHHILVRLTDDHQLRALFHSRITVPVRFGVLLLVPAFVIAGERSQPDLFSADLAGGRLTGYWLVTGSLIIYLSTYGGRALLILRPDPRATATVNTYLASSAFGIAGSMLQMSTAWSARDVSPGVWLCACLAVSIFAYGSARSWQAKVAWFTPEHPRPVPPQPST